MRKFQTKEIAQICIIVPDLEEATLGEGMFTDDRYDMDGGVAICEVNNLQGLMWRDICLELCALNA